MTLQTQLPVQIVNAGLVYAYGCQVDVAPPSDVLISAGQVRDYTNTYDIVVNEPLTVSTAFVGPGGLDQGTIAADTFYAVYVLYDVSHTNPPVGLLSTVSKAPVMPSRNGVTYTSYRVVGYVKTDALSVLLDFSPVGTGNDRELFWGDSIGVLIGGTATTYAPVSLDVAVPSIIGMSDFLQDSISVSLTAALTPSAAGESVRLANFNEPLGQQSCELSASVSAVRQAAQLNLAANFNVLNDYRIKYHVTLTGSVDLSVCSFKYSI